MHWGQVLSLLCIRHCNMGIRSLSHRSYALDARPPGPPQCTTLTSYRYVGLPPIINTACMMR